MKRLLTSCLGLGWLPIAPGTWGSVPPAIIYALLSYSAAPNNVVAVVMAMLVLAGSVICVRCSDGAVKAKNRKDPGEVVSDELAGQALTFLLVFFVSPRPIWAAAVLGFLFFRFFDILKPPPLRSLEKLKDGWGILADDLAAGIYAAILLLICHFSGLLNFFA